MGYPSGAMILPDDQAEDKVDPIVFAQFNVLGNAFAIKPMAHILSHLGGAFGSSNELPPTQDISFLPATHQQVMLIMESFPKNGGR